MATNGKGNMPKPSAYFSKASVGKPSVEVLGYIKCMCCTTYLARGKLFTYNNVPTRWRKQMGSPCTKCKGGPSWWFEMATINLNSRITVQPGDCVMLNYSVQLM